MFVHPRVPAEVYNAGPGSAPDILRIARLSSSPPHDRDELIALRADVAVCSLVALRGRVTVGFAYYRLLGSRRAELLTLAVDPALRRLGVGRTLAERVCSDASRLGRRVVAASPHQDDRDAWDFLTACGWRFLRVEHDRYGDGQDGYRLIREVDPLVWKECAGR